MPIDPSIALSYRNPQIESPASIAAQSAALRNSSIQAAAGIERLKSEQLANQEVGLKRKDDEYITKAWQDAGGDPAKTVEFATKYGARPQAVQGLQKHFLDSAEQTAKLADEDRKAQAAKADRLMALTTQAGQIPDDQYAAAWPQIRAAAQAIDPKDKTLAALPDQPIPKADLSHLQFGIVTHKAILDQAEELRKQEKAKQDALAAADTHAREQAGLPKVQAEAAAAQRQQDAVVLASAARQGANKYYEVLHSLPPERAKAFDGIFAPEKILQAGMNPEAQVTTAGQAQTRAETERRNREQAQFERSRLAIQARRLEMEGSTTMMVPQQGGGYQAVRVRPGDKVPDGAINAAGMSSLTVPTASSRSMIEAAPKVTNFVDRINQLIDQQEKNLGPASSRFREFMAGKLGESDPEYVKLRTDIGLLQTALMRMHVGARGGSEMMNHFKNLIDASKQDPDNLRAALGEIRDYAQTVGGNHVSPAPQKSAAAPEISSQAEYDKLPKGAAYTWNGVPHVKK